MALAQLGPEIAAQLDRSRRAGRRSRQDPPFHQGVIGGDPGASQEDDAEKNVQRIEHTLGRRTPRGQNGHQRDGASGPENLPLIVAERARREVEEAFERMGGRQHRR